MVDAGLASTVEPVVALKPEAGDQLKVLAPLAVKVVMLPAQIVGEAGLTETAGNGVTVTVVVWTPEHPPVVPVMV